MSKKDVDARKALEILRDPALELPAAAERLGASRAATDEARCLVEEIAEAETDAILAMPPVLGRALLWAASAAGRHDVLCAAAEEGDKELQREVKRIAHVLKQRGVELELPTRQAATPPVPQEAAVQEPPVFLSSIDPAGERAVFWTRPLPGRGVEMAQLVVSDRRGIVDLLVAELSRKRFRELLEELPRRGEVTIYEASRQDARQVIDRARVIARDEGRMPAHFPAWAAQVFGPAPAEMPPPLEPVAEGAPLRDPAVLSELVSESITLFSEPEIARWVPPESALRSCALEVETAAGSSLYVDEAQREAGITAAIERCATTHFDEEARRLWSARLRDMGRLLEATERPHAAKIAAATAAALTAGEAAASIPFCVAFFARLFAGGAPAPAGQGPAAGGLIVPGS